MICSNIKQVFIIFCCLTIIVGCTERLFSNNNKQPYTVSNNNNFYPIVEEYINRVGKRLLIVNDDPEILNNKLKIKFYFNNDDLPLFNIKVIYHPLTSIIVINKGILNNLLDEAELATILAIGIELVRIKVNSNSIDDLLSVEDVNKKIINSLYKSGYDPMTYIELQEEYLDNCLNNINPSKVQCNWFGNLFSVIKVDQNIINFNKKLVLNMPKGLQRGKQRFLSIVNLLK